MSFNLRLLEFDPTTESLVAYIDSDVLAAYFGIPVEELLTKLVSIYHQLPEILYDSLIQLFIENGVDIEEGICYNMSMAFGGFKNNNVNVVLVAASLWAYSSQDMLTKISTIHHKLTEGELQIGNSAETEVKSAFKTYSFIGTLTEIETMVVAGLFDNFTDTRLYKNKDKYELVATGPKDAVAVVEYFPKELNSHWEVFYAEHRAQDCVMAADAVQRIRSYCGRGGCVVKNRKKCVLKALFRMGFRIFYYVEEGDLVCVYLTEVAEKPFMLCHPSLIIKVSDEEESNYDTALGGVYPSVGFIHSHQREYDDIPEEYGYTSWIVEGGEVMVALKGLRMPRNCWECSLTHDNFNGLTVCTVTGEKLYPMGTKDERAENCPLVEVTEVQDT